MMSYDKDFPNAKIGCSNSNDPELLEQLVREGKTNREIALILDLDYGSVAPILSRYLPLTRIQSLIWLIASPLRMQCRWSDVRTASTEMARRGSRIYFVRRCTRTISAAMEKGGRKRNRRRREKYD